MSTDSEAGSTRPAGCTRAEEEAARFSRFQDVMG